MKLLGKPSVAPVLFAGLLACVWLAPGTSDDVEVAGNPALAAPVKIKKFTAPKPRTRAATTTPAVQTAQIHHHRSRVHAALTHLHYARRDLDRQHVTHGGHRARAIRDISHAQHELHALLNYLYTLR
jgi:hypothetical protein